MIRQREYDQARQDAYHRGDYDAIERIIDAEAAGVSLVRPEPIAIRSKGTKHSIDPGAGAIAYVQEYVAGLTREEAEPIVHELCAALPYDKRVKQCEYCRYPWRDGSLRNTKRSCCAECKKAIRSLQRRQSRADKALLEPEKKKKTKRDEYYIWWLEYPFWLDEYEMMKQTWKREVTHDSDLIDFVHGQKEIYGEGNRKTKPHKPGAEDEKAGRKFNAYTRARLRGF